MNVNAGAVPDDFELEDRPTDGGSSPQRGIYTVDFIFSYGHCYMLLDMSCVESLKKVSARVSEVGKTC